MKKLLAVVLALVMVLSLAACSNGEGKNGEETGKIDMSKYPADPSEWTSENLISYFKEAGVFTNEDWLFTQDHATYYAATAIDECVSYMDEEGLVTIGIFTTDPSNGDADVEAFLKSVRETKMLPEDLGAVPMDHMVGDLIFWYSITADEAVYNAMDAAYKQLVEALGVTPDF